MLAVAGLMMTLLLGRITKAVFFGQLRDVEIEILYDNARYAVTETCLALTIFREELTTRYQYDRETCASFRTNAPFLPDLTIYVLDYNKLWPCMCVMYFQSLDALHGPPLLQELPLAMPEPCGVCRVGQCLTVRRLKQSYRQYI